MSARRLAALVAASLLVAGCTSDRTPAGPPGPSASPSRDTAAEVTAPEAPADGACYRLSYAQATEPTNRSRPVDCTERHTAQTVHVGRLDTFVDGHAVSVDSEHVQRQIARTCPRVAARHLGGSAEARDLSRFEVVWFSPTIEESDRGARWFRCDVIALAAEETLARLPAPDRLAGILDSEQGRTAFGLCGTAAPGSDGFERVLCAREHGWRAVATIPLPGGAAYPGQKAVRSAGDQPCSDRVRDLAPDPLQFEYGWEWPTREQWRAGQRYGYCWAPD